MLKKTLKDLNFLEIQADIKENVIHLDEFEKNDIIKQMKSDCALLRKFALMDYSLYIKIENIDEQSLLNESNYST